jgi:hypothetical protein
MLGGRPAPPSATFRVVTAARPPPGVCPSHAATSCASSTPSAKSRGRAAGDGSVAPVTSSESGSSARPSHTPCPVAAAAVYPALPPTVTSMPIERTHLRSALCLDERGTRGTGGGGAGRGGEGMKGAITRCGERTRGGEGGGPSFRAFTPPPPPAALDAGFTRGVKEGSAMLPTRKTVPPPAPGGGSRGGRGPSTTLPSPPHAPYTAVEEFHPAPAPRTSVLPAAWASAATTAGASGMRAPPSIPRSLCASTPPSGPTNPSTRSCCTDPGAPLCRAFTTSTAAATSAATSRSSRTSRFAARSLEPRTAA